MNNKEKQWKLKYPKGKSVLSWNIEDYIFWGDEPPDLISDGKSEGELMDKDEALDYIAECLVSLKVIKEEYPERFKNLKEDLILDLDYLVELGKITETERDAFLKEEI